MGQPHYEDEWHYSPLKQGTTHVNNTASHLSRHQSSAAPLWEPQISQSWNHLQVWDVNLLF